MYWLVFCLLVPRQDAEFPDLAEIFTEHDRAGLERVLPANARIQTNLMPLLSDHGNISREQVLIGFDKLQDRFEVVEGKVTNAQSDSNYAWLEVFLALTLRDRKTDLVYFCTFAFYYKIIGSKVLINRWVLQDIH